MREICTSGSVGGEGGNILTYSALRLSVLFTDLQGFQYWLNPVATTCS